MEQLSVNQMIGDYRIVRFLGAGGMGEVYQGVHIKIGRPVAIKVLSKMSSNSSFTNRFFNEARVQSSILHPNIVTLYDFQEIGGRLFIFMEFVDGESLEDLIERRAFAVEDAIKTFQPIVEAVAYIHRHGILHRDLKSQNIKLTLDGTVKLLDFGIAKDAYSQHLTQTGGVIGTPRYLAPEQLDGKPANFQTDVWALGILFYEMLTGVAPFQSDSMMSLYGQIRNARFAKPETLNRAVTGEISKIVVRCLNSKPTERYTTAGELLRDIQAISGGEKEQISGGKKFLRRYVASGGNESNDADSNQVSSKSLSSRRNVPFIPIAVGSIVGVLLLFGLVAVSMWAMSGSNLENSAANNSLIITSKDKTPTKLKDKNEITQQGALNANTNVFHIDIWEGKAQVLRDGQEIGITPFDYPLKDKEKAELTLRREGFEDKQVLLDGSSFKRVITVGLKPK